MKIKKINYINLGKTLNNFYLLCNLIPGIKISKISKKGMVTITEAKGFLFFRKKTRKHIYYLLFFDIIKCLSVRFWGNTDEDTIQFYRDKLKKALKGDENEISNIKNIINLLYLEWTERVLSIDSQKTEYFIPISKLENKKENNIIEELPKEIPNLLDLIFSIGIPNLKLTCKKMLITASLIGLINSSIIFIKRETRYNYINFINGMRAPPNFIGITSDQLV